MLGTRQSSQGTGPFEAVIFDCDGLLLDTEECWARGEASFVEERGREYTPELRHQLLGVSNAEAGKVLAGLLDRPGQEALLARALLERCWSIVVEGARPRPGVEELVTALRSHTPLAVASNSPGRMVREALEAAGMDGSFDVIVGGDEVARPKPAADVYLAACGRLGATPGRSAALEDSPPGISAAKAAGLYVVGVPSKPDVPLDADLVSASLAESAVWQILGLTERIE